mgnify:CR=1 FL=1
MLVWVEVVCASNDHHFKALNSNRFAIQWKRKIALKILVLGFDGASPQLIDDWIDELPVFRKFKKEGVFGHTIPPIPAQTPVAWATFMTGKNPGNHGVFSFFMREKGSYERKIVGPETLKSKTIWHLLNEAGRKVATINVPMSDEEEGGLVVPGFLSRSEGIPSSNFRARIERKFKTDRIQGDLEIDTLERVEADPDSFFEKINEITDKMTEICLYLLQEEEWDFFMPVYMGLDRIQHFFWRHVDPTHPRHEENKYGKAVKNFYAKVDRIVDDFPGLVDEDTMVMVLSDHGFCPVHTEVVLNDYLEHQGFSTTRSERVDVVRSKAISYGYGDIWLNVKGRESKGVIGPGEEYERTRNEIIEYLRTITIDGQKPFKDIRKREELWWGSYLSDAPDLTAIFNIGYQAARRPEVTGKNSLKRYVNNNPRWSGGHDGTHDPTDVPGILGLLGPGIPNRSGVEVPLWDVAPTILDLMRIPVPVDMDGRPLKLTE